MSEVVYFEFGTHDLQVVPTACLNPQSNYLWVDRPFAYETFNLIDVVAIDQFETRPTHYRIESGNKHIATLHWDERIPHHLKYKRVFLVGPMDLYLTTIRELPRHMNPPGPPDPSTAIPPLGLTSIVPPPGPSTAYPAQDQPYGSPTAHPPHGQLTAHPQDIPTAYPPHGQLTAHPQDPTIAHPSYGQLTAHPQDLTIAHPSYAQLAARPQDLAIAHLSYGPSPAHSQPGSSIALPPGSSYTHPPGSSSARRQVGVSTASPPTEGAPLPHDDEEGTLTTDDGYEEADSP